MSKPIILVQAAPASPSSASNSPQDGSGSISIWMVTSGMLLVAVIALGVTLKLKVDGLKKKLRLEEIKNNELRKKFKLATETITKMERNPDLVHSREFNLDYLRMRMAEEVFNFAIVNQIKVKVKNKISIALRPTQASEGGVVGIASTARKVDEIFDVEYDPSTQPKSKTKRVLFRVQIRLTKLPTQPTSMTVEQIITCIEKYLSPSNDEDGQDNWQPTIQGRIAQIHWDQKAKPTPLLVLEQTNEGTNVTFRTSKQRVATTKRGGSSVPAPQR